MKELFTKMSLIIISLTTIVSCKKFVGVGQPKNQITSTEVFADSTDASASLLGIYISIMDSPLGLCSGGLTLVTGLSSDELYQTANNPVYNQFYVNNILTNNNTDNGLWTAGYKYIYSANACIEGVTASSGISLNGKTRITAEARFIRGFVYFNMVNLYGGVPVITSTNYDVNSLAARSTTDQVFAQIISDLQFAELNLGTNTGSNDRPNSLTASALLAKVYLYQGKYDLSQAEATKVISSGNFNLEPDLNNVFTASSAETIWQFDLVYVNYTWEGQAFVPSSSTAIPKYVITSGLFSSFETGDQRQINWTAVDTVSGIAYPYPFKYKNNTAVNYPAENYVILRLADQYLIRAEAEASQNNLNAAAVDLNMIRSRAGLPNTTAVNKTSLMSSIIEERRVEMFCEWGNRWFDLKRLNLATEALSPLKANWNVNDQLYPIPLPQINTNPHLTQNPGY